MNQDQNPDKQKFSHSQFKQKDKLKHTFRINNQNANYYNIPIFQKDETIKFNDKFYKIIKLQRRAETYLQYKIQHLDSGEKFIMEYQFIFDEKQKDQNQEYYQDQIIGSSNESKVYKQFCRIALKKNIQDQHNSLKLTRFIHLNNLNQNAKIKLLHAFANDNQLQQLDYNQIYIDDKWQIKIQKNQQNQVCCFLQAPTSISPIINYQQTFLIGFYYAILNNQVLFNQYMNRENSLKQSLQNGIRDSNFQLQQQIRGSINYQYKLQIPKNFLLQEIKRIYDQNQIIELGFKLISLLNFIINQQLKEYDALLIVYNISYQQNNNDLKFDLKNKASQLTIQKSFYYQTLLILEQLNEIIQNPQNHKQHSGLTDCFHLSYKNEVSKHLKKFQQNLNDQDIQDQLFAICEMIDDINNRLKAIPEISKKMIDIKQEVINLLKMKIFKINDINHQFKQQEMRQYLDKFIFKISQPIEESSNKINLSQLIQAFFCFSEELIEKQERRNNSFQFENEVQEIMMIQVKNVLKEKKRNNTDVIAHISDDLLAQNDSNDDSLFPTLLKISKVLTSESFSKILDNIQKFFIGFLINYKTISPMITTSQKSDDQVVQTVITDIAVQELKKKKLHNQPLYKEYDYLDRYFLKKKKKSI